MIVPGLKEMLDEMDRLDKAPRCPYCGQKMTYSQGMTVARYQCDCGAHAPWVHASLEDCQKRAYEAAIKRVKE